MAAPRDTRRLTLLALYQLDARGGALDAEALAEASADVDVLEDDIDGSRFVPGGVTFSERDRRKAAEIALAAWADRAAADEATVAVAPEWPAHRQAAIDRAILRLAHHELVASLAPPRVVINEAVELAKVFSTEKSPAFINGVLGKLVTIIPAAVKALANAPLAGADPADALDPASVIDAANGTA